MQLGRFEVGDIVSMGLKPDHAVAPATRGPALPFDVLGLIETPTTGSASAAVWTPFAAWTGTSRFVVPVDLLTVAGHIRLLDAWTVSVQTEQEQQMMTIPQMIGRDQRTRLRLAFLGWYFEFGPGAGEEADLNLLMFLAEQ